MAENDVQNDTGDNVVEFGPTLPPDPSQEIANKYEARRYATLMSDTPILPDFLGRKTWLDEYKPEDLPDAAADILLAHTARMLIRTVSRYENAWTWLMHSDRISSTPLERESLAQFRIECDQARNAFLETRERLERIAHLESINRRSRTIPLPRVRVRPGKSKTA